MPFHSYAQNAEDVPLWRIFKDQPEGFYVDVGASGPNDSITRVFYEKGWSGVNIDPLPHFIDELNQVRPRDTNLQLAVSNHSGTATLYASVDAALGGLSTLDAGHSADLQKQGYATKPVEVPMTTLAEICATHANRPIDFLKIDVEGHEKGVIEGADWTRWRPRVLVIEATEPMSPKPAHQEWEPLLVNAGYLFALFDGLNRFYVREEDRELLPILSAPPNVFDNYIPNKFSHYIKWLETTVAERSEALHIATHERNHFKYVMDMLQERDSERERQIDDLARHLRATSEELQRYMSLKGVMRWAKHRTKVALGHYRRQAS